MGFSGRDKEPIRFVSEVDMIFAPRTYLYKRTHRSGNVTWMVRWKKPDTGLWQTVLGGKTKNEALAIETRIRSSLLNGTIPNSTPSHLLPQVNANVSFLIDEFYFSPRYLAVSLEWRKSVRSQMERVIRPHFGKYMIHELQKETVYKVYFSFKEKGISHSTIKKYHYKLAILGELFSERYPQYDNLFKKFRDFDRLFPKQTPTPTRNIDFLTPEELEQIYLQLKCARSPLILPFVKLLANTRLRRGEALNLKWTDIDLNIGMLHVRKSKTGSLRSIPLDSMAKQALLSLSSQNHTYVFSTKDGSRYHRCSFLKPLQSAVKTAGIKKRIDVHSLRHSFGSNKIRAGFGLKKISLLLGHADIQTTSSIYTHLLDGDLRVKDEVTFKEHPGSKQIFGTDLVTDALSKLMIALKTSNLQFSLESVAKLLNDSSQLATESFGSKPNSSQKKTENLQDITPMLRETGKASCPPCAQDVKITDFASDFIQLSTSIQEAGKGSRTLDLELGKLAL